ncbi:hypothetical protein M9458_051514 [Cirrhinus mrigala]|uniref:Uncharacterized protein n=1 Tax=Cirrhinus mrigala TaxID=683832 RepID=A0ABD0MVI4_CIRMR
MDEDSEHCSTDSRHKVAETALQMEEASDVRPKRTLQLTEKALELKLHNLIKDRKLKMGQITKLMNEIDSLKDDERNLNNVEEKLQKNFSELNKEFNCLNAELGVLLSEEERKADHDIWFQHKAEYIEEFVKLTQTWILTTKDKIEAFNIGPEDSVSVVSLQRQKNKYGSVAGRMSNASSRSSSSAAHLKQEAEHAALLARAAALKRKQSIEQEVAKLKAEQEQLEIDTEIAASFAKLKVFKDYDLLLENKNECQSGNADIRRKKEQKDPSLVEQHSKGDRTPPPSQRTHSTRSIKALVKDGSSGELEGNLYRVMQRQNEIIEMFVRQQNVSHLPPRDIPIFSGNLMEYRTFVRAFEHAIDNKTENARDKLYYLEQYTGGEAKDLVRSCVHMEPNKGYKKAWDLLHKEFGDELKIASAYIDKMLNWAQIKQEDGKALKTYALFLIGCRNVMEDLEYMDEMDNPTNVRIVISKLPFKLKEKWRGKAFEIQEKRGRRARFADLVDFIDREAKVVTDPLYGEIQSFSVGSEGK